MNDTYTHPNRALRARLFRNRLVVVRDVRDETGRRYDRCAYGPQILDRHGIWHQREEGWAYGDGDGIVLTEAQLAILDTGGIITLRGNHLQGHPICRLLRVRKSPRYDPRYTLAIVEDVGFENTALS